MKVITIGREKNNDVIINDPAASRYHLQIIQDNDGNFRLADFGSKNGTFVNGQKVSGEMYLSENDIVCIGSTTLPWRQYFAPTGKSAIIGLWGKVRKFIWGALAVIGAIVVVLLLLGLLFGE